jgi:hypothetical protein
MKKQPPGHPAMKKFLGFSERGLTQGQALRSQLRVTSVNKNPPPKTTTPRK